MMYVNSETKKPKTNSSMCQYNGVASSQVKWNLQQQQIIVVEYLVHVNLLHILHSALKQIGCYACQLQRKV